MCNLSRSPHLYQGHHKTFKLCAYSPDSTIILYVYHDIVIKTTKFAKAQFHKVLLYLIAPIIRFQDRESRATYTSAIFHMPGAQLNHLCSWKIFMWNLQRRESDMKHSNSIIWNCCEQVHHHIKYISMFLPADPTKTDQQQWFIVYQGTNFSKPERTSIFINYTCTW